MVVALNWNSWLWELQLCVDSTKISTVGGATEKIREHKNIAFLTSGTHPNAKRNWLKPSQNIQRHRLHQLQPHLKKQELKYVGVAQDQTHYQEYLEPNWPGPQSSREELPSWQQKTTFSQHKKLLSKQ